MTLRRTGSWLAYAVLPALVCLVAIGVPFPSEAGVAIMPVAHGVEAVQPLPPTPAPASEQAPESPLPESPASASEPATEPDPCLAALDGVAAGGLHMPDGVDYQCPSTYFNHQGAACWDAWPCPGAAFIAINMSRLGGASPEYLRHVVAHEICHIIDFRDRGWSTEPGADACAAAYGF